MDIKKKSKRKAETTDWIKLGSMWRPTGFSGSFFQRNLPSHFFLHQSFGLKGSSLKSKIMNNAVTVPVPNISGSLVIFMSIPIISNNAPTTSKI